MDFFFGGNRCCMKNMCYRQLVLMAKSNPLPRSATTDDNSSGRWSGKRSCMRWHRYICSSSGMGMGGGDWGRWSRRNGHSGLAADRVREERASASGESTYDTSWLPLVPDEALKKVRAKGVTVGFYVGHMSQKTWTVCLDVNLMQKTCPCETSCLNQNGIPGVPSASTCPFHVPGALPSRSATHCTNCSYPILYNWGNLFLPGDSDLIIILKRKPITKNCFEMPCAISCDIL